MVEMVNSGSLNKSKVCKISLQYSVVRGGFLRILILLASRWRKVIELLLVLSQYCYLTSIACDSEVVRPSLWSVGRGINNTY